MRNIERMKNLVEISKIVTESDNFFEIKDLIINKMLNVVHPTKACVNLFYGNDYSYAHLVCSATLEYIPVAFPKNEEYGSKIDFDVYPQYIHEAVKEKKIVIVDNVFENSSAKGEECLAINEKYQGRAVFPFVLENKTVGFLSCYTTEDEKLEQDDIDFISQVASLMTLSISITNKNRGINQLVNKLRSSMSNINKASMEMYSSKDIQYYLKKMSSVISESLRSECTVIKLFKKEDGQIVDEKINHVNPISRKEDVDILFPVFLNSKKHLEMNNDMDLVLSDGTHIKSYIYKRFIMDSDEELVILCAGSSEYSSDDKNIMSIISRQIYLNIQTFERMKVEERHKNIDNELSILNKQQKLIMDCSSVDFNGKKEMYFFHEPAKVVGGDFYNAIDLGDTMAFIIADVMGHGVASNYIVAIIKGAFEILVQYSKSPKEIMSKLNNHLYREFDEMGMYATLIVGVYNKLTDSLIISNAGHYQPILIDYNNKGVDLEGPDHKNGLPIGIMQNASYSEFAIDMGNVKNMAFFTDGILEIKNDDGEEFGTERLKTFLIDNADNDKNTVLNSIDETIKSHINSHERKDDILVVFLKNNILNS